ncbi:hypothetical protein HMPREF1624_01175 [Sporothrix schenckii ATCC 58251]|uniref:Phospholipase/carboxylesterase/thioesterase domain-containing protein n=1 Tax=Sporothrix schenckii (strain ATCC 58251 / de Perez 2211183) TaxID=1391915 RepID=U7Q6R0_SPOS1|nr:hypothetical protein HMPREF1624_01175 [Sporothrix schenckii ATCC 58251]
MTRVPTEDDFKGLAPDVNVALHFPDPPASTTAILLLFHGLGDSESPFAAFARAVNLPGVLAIAVRGTSVLPPSLVAGTEAGDTSQASFGHGPQHFHWGDDLRLDGTGQLDDDPGFDAAVQRVDSRLIQDVLVRACGWRYGDILLFGFGQGGTFALALAARVAAQTAATPRAITDKPSTGTTAAFKGIVAIGAAVPSAITGAPTSAPRLATPLLVCGAAGNEAVSAETQGMLRRRFAAVDTAAWHRPDDEDNGMPRNRAEMLPIMQFLAKRLQR